ncbi:MAG: hypothetical protein IT447_09535 [Phycisphaerales bacterium]|nr:hypothetical protein [Phycisphaerales bacterium]
MRRRRPNRSILFALYLNAAMLALVAVALLARKGDSSILQAAYGQNQPPIAGGAGVFVMPGQLSSNTWGCFLLDVDAQTLCVYQYSGGDRDLRLVAARGFRYDRRLTNYNTQKPSPQEVKALLEKEQNALRGENPPPTTNP